MAITRSEAMQIFGAAREKAGDDDGATLIEFLRLVAAGGVTAVRQAEKDRLLARIAEIEAAEAK